LSTLSAAAVNAVICDSITSTGPGDPTLNRSAQVAGPSRISSFVETS
jgi:hypothetical protein